MKRTLKIVAQDRDQVISEMLQEREQFNHAIKSLKETLSTKHAECE